MLEASGAGEASRLTPVRPRAFAIDLDGTLLGPGDEVSERNRRAIAAAREAGLHVIIATARWYQNAEHAAASLGLRGPLIACSGAEVRRFPEGADLFDVRLPDGFARALPGGHGAGAAPA
jgi:hydroxymethylpyrimidine pyrophosphatase-like HAD family hydrolase